MPWTSKQWRAIASRVMSKYGKKAGRQKLHQYKMEAGGHAVKKPRRKRGN